MLNGGKEQKNFKKRDFYKVIKFKTEVFQCCCFYLSVFIQKWNVPMEKWKVPLGSLSHQKPQPKVQFLARPPNHFPVG